mmetsp:Transcript_39721/g.58948  ORF Transcript_39721/g.58948 Transcript_39721/m.58948 type:complete len:80 (+) Transcript_39721:93-332(+)
MCFLHQVILVCSSSEYDIQMRTKMNGSTNIPTKHENRGQGATTFPNESVGLPPKSSKAIRPGRGTFRIPKVPAGTPQNV